MRHSPFHIDRWPLGSFKPGAAAGLLIFLCQYGCNLEILHEADQTTATVAVVEIDPASVLLPVGSSTLLTATLKDIDGNVLTDRVVTWASSSATVVTVDSDGWVTGVAEGTANVTATSEERTDTARVTVTTSSSVRSIAVLGCSNTGQHAEGYKKFSDLDLLADVSRGDLSGGLLRRWTAEEKYWDVVERERPANGYELAWVQICLRHDDRDEVKNRSDITAVVSRLGSDYALATERILVSPINFYVEGHVCDQIGADGSEVAAALADWATANLGTVRGPDTGPLNPEHLSSDGCHLIAAGKNFVGQQLVDYFDAGSPP